MHFKSFLSLLLLLLPSLNLIAQDSTSNNYFPFGVWKVDGKVGIGTKVPVSTLDVRGVSNNQSFTIKDYSTGNNLLYFNTSSGFPYFNLYNTQAISSISLNTNGATYFLGGRIGVGTDNPNSLLHISSQSIGDAVLTIEADRDNNNENDNPQIQFLQDGGTHASSIGHGITNLSPNQNTLEIANSISSGGVLLSTGPINNSFSGNHIGIHLDNTGKLGFGKLAGADFLESAGTVRIHSVHPENWERNLVLGNFTGRAYSTLDVITKDFAGMGYVKYFGRRWGINHYWSRGSSTGEKTIAYLGGTNGGTTFSIFNPDSVRSVNFSSNNNSYVNNAYSFGVGTNSPTAKLHVEGSAKFSNSNGSESIIIEGSGTTNYAGSYLSMKAGDISTGNAFNQVQFITHRGTTGDGYFAFQRRLNNTYHGELLQYSDVHGWRFFTALNKTSTGTNEALRITPDGKVGIGVDVVPAGYLFAVDGKMLTEKVIVRKSENWPDFVFEKDYILPPLSEIEEYIEENKHLPEIPSASQVEEDGQDLAEMNRLLLKKVEELTLYLIEEHNLNKSQQKEIEVLKESIKQLQK